MGGAAAGRTASDARELAGLEVETGPGFGRMLVARTQHRGTKRKRPAAVPWDCHRLLGAARGRLGLRGWASQSYADQYTPASSGWTTPQDAQEIWPLV